MILHGHTKFSTHLFCASQDGFYVSRKQVSVYLNLILCKTSNGFNGDIKKINSKEKH